MPQWAQLHWDLPSREPFLPDRIEAKARFAGHRDFNALKTDSPTLP
jgi:hypothetical protein